MIIEASDIVSKFKNMVASIYLRHGLGSHINCDVVNTGHDDRVSVLIDGKIFTYPMDIVECVVVHEKPE
jgi:hypothetical protein